MHARHAGDADPLFDRESIVPVTLGLIISLVLCVVVVPTSAKVLFSGNYLAPADGRESERARPDRSDADEEENSAVPPDPDLVPLGNDDPNFAAVAWISHDDYQDLIAPTSETVQPALQEMVDPVEEAAHRVEATNPAPPSRETEPMPTATHFAQATPAEPRPPAEPEPLAPPLDVPTPQEADPDDPTPPTPEAPGRQQEPLPELEATDQGQVAEAEPAPEPVKAPEPAKTQGRSRKNPLAKKPAAPKTPTAERAAATPPTSNRPAKPTASPRSDREAPPVDIKPDVERVRVGRVFTAQGIEIKPAVPRISVQTSLTAMRAGIRVPVSVTFDTKGRVVDAKLKGRSGYPEIDSPIRSSLYRWSASGKKLATMKRPFRVTIDIIIGNRL